MEIEISRDIRNNLERTARELGLSEKEIVLKALMLYFKNAKQCAILQREIKEWENMGLKDSVNFFEKNNL